MFHVKHVLLTGFLACCSMQISAAAHRVTLPGKEVKLTGLLYATRAKAPGPAVVMLHGCSGLFDRAGRPTKSYVFWAEHFQGLGYTVLLLDSFTARGQREICTQKERSITPEHERSADARAAFAWLAAKEGVDAQRIHLLGWSNGAMAVLHAIKKDSGPTQSSSPKFRSAVAFYPGCAALLRAGGYATETPLLIQSGAEDDWTPSAACEKLVTGAKASGSQAEIDVYPEAHHGFDRLDMKPRIRPEVRNPNSKSGWGATVGTHADARLNAVARVSAFIDRQNQ